jgi:hypothetical protein
MLRRIAIAAGVILLLLIVEDVASSIVVPVHKCSEQTKGTQSTKESCGFAESITYRSTGSAVDWIERRHDFVTAASTIVIAVFTTILGIFTISLAGSTRISANAALRQANAVVALEVPIPSVTEIKLVGYVNGTDNVSNIDPVQQGMPPEFCRPIIRLSNLGRTQMHFQRFCCDWLVCRNLPLEPPYQRISQLGGAFPGNTPPTWFADLTNVIQLTNEERQIMQTGESYLWVFGYFRYLNFMREPAVIGFLRRWDLAQGFVREPNPRYDFQT